MFAAKSRGYVAELVQTANYQGSDEVVSEALREHQVRHQGMEVVVTPELERLLDEGLENLDQSKTTSLPIIPRPRSASAGAPNGFKGRGPKAEAGGQNATQSRKSIPNGSRVSQPQHARLQTDAGT